MPRNKLDEDVVLETRDEICAVAMDLFAERGYAAVTMRAIASELGWSPMKAYRYFNTKHDIFIAVRELSLLELSHAIEAAAVGVEDPVERLRRSFKAYARFSIERRNEYSLAFEVYGDSADGLTVTNENTMKSWKICFQAADEACAAGILVGDPNMITHLIWCGVHGLIELDRSKRLIFDLHFGDIIDGVIETVIDQFRARSTPRRTRGRAQMEQAVS